MPSFSGETSDPQPPDVSVTLRAIEIKLDAILARLDDLSGNRSSDVSLRGYTSDPTDAACLLAIRTATLGGSFSARELIDHSALDPALRDALLACDIEDAVDCGQWCKRLRGVVLNGLLIERDKRTSGGVRWRVRLQG